MDPFQLNGRSLDTDLIILRSLFAIDTVTNLPISSLHILGTDGQGGLNWQDIFNNISTYSKLIGAGVDYLPSSLYNVSNASSNYSSILATGFSTLSTAIALGGIPGSITGNQLFSTTTGITSNTNIFVTSSLVSTVDSFNAAGTGLGPSLISTTTGLGTAGYISSLSFYSTISSLGTVGYVSTLSLYSTVRSLQANDVSSLYSTTTGLGTYGYISTLSLQSSVTGLRSGTQTYLTSSIEGLGAAGYVSTHTLFSSIDGVTRTINVDRAGNLIVYNANVTVSSLQNLSFLSTFHMSSMRYKGNNGNTLGSTTTRDLFFSTANIQIELHRNYIVDNTQITLDVFPNFTFCFMNLVNNTQIFSMSSFLMYDNNVVPNTMINNWVIASGYESGQSNFFNTPFRMSFKGITFCNYDYEYRLCHRIENCMSFNLTGGFNNSNVGLFMASTNSLFYTIINNSF